MPLTVFLNREVIRGIHDAIAASPRDPQGRGEEIGGILLGKLESARPDRAGVRIERFEPVHSEHRRGPSFVLTPRNKLELGRRLKWWTSRNNKEGLRPVGFYRSHTRRGLYLDNDDFSIAQEYFRAPNSVFLLVRPVAGGPGVGGLFFWENGDMHRQSSRLEFPFDPVELPVTALQPTPDRVPVPVRVQAPTPVRVQAPIPDPVPAPMPVSVQPPIPDAPLEPAPVRAQAITPDPVPVPLQAPTPDRVPTPTPVRVQPAPPRVQAAPVRASRPVSLRLSALTQRRYWLRAAIPAAAILLFGLTFLTARKLALPRHVASSAPAPLPIARNVPPFQPASPSVGPVAPVEKPSPVRTKPGDRTESANRTVPPPAAPAPEPEPAEAAPPSPPPAAAVPAEPAAPPPMVASIELPARIERPRKPAFAATVTVEPVAESKLGRLVGKIPGLRRIEKKNRGFVPARPIREIAPTVPASQELAHDVPVDVRVTVNESGNVATIESAKGGDKRLVRLASDAARNWQFEPARRNDEIVSSEMILHFTFRPPDARAEP